MSSSTSRKKIQNDQLWFFLKEEMTLPNFVQQQHTFADIKSNGITMVDCLNILRIKGDTKKYAFYIHSTSMAAAVRLLNDESILATYNLYCQNDDVVVVMVREVTDPSPNSSKAASHESSLKERRKVSRGALVPEIFIQPTPRHASGTVDVGTMETIADESKMVTIDLGRSDFVTFTNEYLTCWISSQVDDGKALTDIVVQSFGPNGVMQKVQLTADIWQRSLIRGPWANNFLPLWSEYNKIRNSREAVLSKLSQQVPNFVQMCQNFIHDLRKFGNDKGAQKRLESTGHAFYLGKPYFSDETRDKILSIPTKNGTLQNDLNLLAVKRDEGEVCAAHDLSPLYEACLGVEWDKKGRKATTLHQQMGGLSLQSPQPQPGPSKAKQLVKKSSNLFKSTFSTKGGRRGGDENEGSGRFGR